MVAKTTNFKHFEVQENKPYYKGDVYAELLEQLKRVADALEDMNEIKRQELEVKP